MQPHAGAAAAAAGGGAHLALLAAVGSPLHPALSRVREQAAGQVIDSPCSPSTGGRQPSRHPRRLNHARFCSWMQGRAPSLAAAASPGAYSPAGGAASPGTPQTREARQFQHDVRACPADAPLSAEQPAFCTVTMHTAKLYGARRWSPDRIQLKFS
eukprot:COSAG01_NODE_66_length_29241_cov_17.772768_29_plen_156_part_00